MKAVVEIKGGFGSQIFQYAFANYLKTKGYRNIRCKYYINN